MTNLALGNTARYKWQVVFMLWWVCFFNYADRQGVAAVFPELQRQFHFRKEELGLIASSFMWVYAVASLVAGPICDRFRRRDLILGGCLFWSAVTVSTGWCSTLWQFILVRALEGLGETFYFPASMSLTSDYHSSKTRSRALAWHQSSVYAGTILGSWASAWLAVHFGWSTGFYVFGVAGILLSFLLFRFLREPIRGASDSASDSFSDAGNLAADKARLGLRGLYWAIFKKPSVLLLMLAFAAANSVATVFLVWTPTFLVEKFHFSLAMAGLSGTLFIHLASAVSVPFAGWSADQLAKRYPSGRIMVQTVGLLTGAVFVYWVGKTTQFAMLVTAMVIFGIGKGFYDSGIFASLYDSVEPRARGTVAGLMNLIGWGGGAVGPWWVGRIADRGNRSTSIENMSDAISWGGLIYLFAAVLLMGAIYLRTTNRWNKPA